MTIRRSTARAAHPTAPTRPANVHVRMYRALEEVPDAQRSYRGLLGDCFLIRLERGDVRSHILIDCGMLLGSPAARPRMQAIATDIARTCGGDPAAGRPGLLDLVVVTHEHWDHLSGFSQAADVFFDATKLTIANVWMAWTEDPDDDLAKELRRRFDASATAFAMIGERLRDGSRFGADSAERVLHGMDGFMGLAATTTAGAPPRLAGRDVIERLKAHNPAYLRPGEAHDTPGALSLHAFVLGPPHDKAKLFKDKPTARNPETYLDEPSIDGAHLLRFAAGDDPDPLRDSPFAPPYCRFLASDIDTPMASGTPPDGEVREFIRRLYYGTPDMDAQIRAALDRRRIDSDWLGSASTFALKLDSDTNNTSLVLALELPGAEAGVMLFAADAQVGNWESWHDQHYPADGSAPPVTAADLLARTRMYKVGHHGSHNATLKAHGLEMMTRPDLFAMIPTDEELGKAQGSRGWLMPNPRVKAALSAVTGGRILRADRWHHADARAADPDLKNVDPAFFDDGRLTETNLYLDYRLL